MSTEPDRTLTRLYADLGAEAQHAPLPGPDVLRRRGDRRTRSRATLAVAAAAVLVAAVAAGGNAYFEGRGVRVEPAPPPKPSVTPSVTSTASPSATPSPSVTPSATPSATQGSPTATAGPPPTSIPARAFVSGVRPDAGPADRYLPSLCRASIPDNGLVSKRSLTGHASTAQTQAAASPPDAQLAERIAVYRTPSQAWAFVADVASRTADCPREVVESGTIRYRGWPDAPRVGHDSYVIEQRIPATDLYSGEPTGSYWTFYTAVVRHGDTVAVLYTYPYEDWGIEDPQLIVGLMRQAYERLAAWRGPMSGSRGTG